MPEITGRIHVKQNDGSYIVLLPETSTAQVKDAATGNSLSSMIIGIDAEIASHGSSIAVINDILDELTFRVVPIYKSTGEYEGFKIYPAISYETRHITFHAVTIPSDATVSPRAMKWYTRTGAGTAANPYVYDLSTDTAIVNNTDYYYAEIEYY